MTTLVAEQEQQIYQALIKARRYVETCTEPHGMDGASRTLKDIDSALAFFKIGRGKEKI